MKDKVIKGGLWLCGFSSCVFLCAILIAHGNNIGLILGLLLLPLMFFCAFKGFKSILSAIFD